MTTPRTWALVSVLGLACASATPPPLTPLGDLGVKALRLHPRSTVLPSGLRLVHERVEGSGAVALVLTIRAGAARDPQGRRGLAHLVEHLTFRARDDSGETLWNRYERLGATRLNAFTDHESTVYVAEVPRASLAAAVALETERLRAPLRGVTDEELATERDVVRNELFERNERNMEGGLMAWAGRALFPDDHRYRHAVGGTPETLASIVPRATRWFAVSHYRPRNATLTVVGDVTHEELLAAARAAGLEALTASGPEPLPDLVHVPLQPPNPPAATVSREQGSFRGPRVWIAWTVPGTYGPAAGAGELVARILGATVTEDYLGTLGDPGTDIAEVGFFIQPGLMASTLFVEAHLRHGHWPERSANAIIDGVVAVGMPSHSSTKIAMAHASLAVLSGLVLQTEDLLARATRYAEVDRVTGDARNAMDRLNRIGETQPDHIQSYFAAYLTKERARIAVVTPRKDEGRPLPTGLDPSLLPLPAPGAAVSGAPPVAPLPSPAGARRFRLPNGLDVVIWPRAGFPSVTATLMFRGGAAAANPAGAEFYLDTVLPMLYCGGPPAFRGITRSTNVLPDAVIELAHGGADNLSAMLLTLAERAAVYRFDEWPVLEALQKERCADLANEEEQARLWPALLAEGKRRLGQERLATGRSASRKATRALGQALFRGTVYEPPPGTALDQLTAADLEEWYRSSRRPENGLLVIVGQVEPDAGEALARGWFSSWRPAPPPRAPRASHAAVAVAASSKLFRVADPGMAQAEIVLGCRMSSASPAETAADQVLARLLARDLRRRLREQLGATYGVREALIELKVGATMMTLKTDVAREHLGTALTAMVARIDALAALAPAADELRRAQLDVFRDLAGPASSLRLNTQVVRTLMLGQPLEELDRASAAASRVGPEAVRAAAAACRRSLNLAVVADLTALASVVLPGFVIEELE